MRQTVPLLQVSTPPRVTSRRRPYINSAPKLARVTQIPSGKLRASKMQKHKAEEKEKEEEEEEEQDTPLIALNHVSRVCRSVKESMEFYTKVLGFVVIKRPESFDFDGAWLFNYGVGIHLVQSKDEEKLPRNKERLDPMDNHISFQCEDMEAMVRKLEEMKIKYMKRSVGEGEGATIDQLFFKDPDGFMIEICNCENLKLVPQRSIGRIKLPSDKHNPPIDLQNGENMFAGEL